MKCGDLYLVLRPGGGDPRRRRVFLVVSRQALIDSKFASVVCAPVYSARYGLSTEVPVGTEEGHRHDSSVHCDALVSLPKAALTRFVGTLRDATVAELDRALIVALNIDAASVQP